MMHRSSCRRCGSELRGATLDAIVDALNSHRRAACGEDASFAPLHPRPDTLA